MTTGIGRWFATSWAGGLVKMFLGLVVGSFVAWLGSAHGTLTSHDVWTWVGAALVIVLPIAINALNPADPRYGKTPAAPDAKPGDS